MTRRTTLISTAAAVFLCSCRKDEEPESEAPVDLLAPEWLSQWKVSTISGAGSVTLKDHVIRLESGAPMTCVQFPSWGKAHLPTTNYAVNLESRRLDGSDFFSAVTFPVGNLEQCITFINGGWGGNTTGLSNLDSQTAAENRTASDQHYEYGHWHHFLIEVRPNEIAVWMDQRIIIRTALAGHHLDVRPGDIETCKPFGLASYNATGEIRRLDVSRLPLE